MHGLTPFQTVGPYFAILLRSRRDSRMAASETPRQITIEGLLLDGAGTPISDGLIEIWQADAQGVFRHPDDPRSAGADPGFHGHGWCHTGTEGQFAFRTVKPGRVPGPDGPLQAPHVLVSVMARGILARYLTRCYFEDEPTNEQDAVLQCVPAPRRSTLVARCTESGSYRFDIVLQGARETVFFDV